MKLSPELRPTLWDGLVVLFIVVLAIGCAGMFWGNGGVFTNRTAVVYADGKEVERVPLLESMEQTYTENGYTLQVRFSQEGVEIMASDCPTQDCVRTGIISKAGQSIVCLPARMIITLEGVEESGIPDLVVG